MEFLVQYLDDIDDLISAVGLVAETIRKLLFSLSFLCTLLALQVGGVMLALTDPPLALAVALLLFVTLLYRLVTAPIDTGYQPA